jgi:hypothetical protein
VYDRALPLRRLVLRVSRRVRDSAGSPSSSRSNHIPLARPPAATFGLTMFCLTVEHLMVTRVNPGVRRSYTWCALRPPALRGRGPYAVRSWADAESVAPDGPIPGTG